MDTVYCVWISVASDEPARRPLVAILQPLCLQVLLERNIHQSDIGWVAHGERTSPLVACCYIAMIKAHCGHGFLEAEAMTISSSMIRARRWGGTY
jgi:hypothetical protein